MTQSGGTGGLRAFGQWVEIALALSVAFLAKGLGSKPGPTEPQC